MEIPYLRAPLYLDATGVRVAGSAEPAETALERELIERVYAGGADLTELAGVMVDHGAAQELDEAAERLREAFGDPHSAVGLLSVDVASDYDVVVVEQGYGGVYVHTIELLKRLRERWSCLLVCPEDPLFDDRSGTDAVTLKRLRRDLPGLTYFSFVHVVRTIVKRTSCKVLLLTHRSQSLFLFDVVGTRSTVIYCDGFYDALFVNAQNFRLDDTPELRRETLREIYYVLANGNPDFMGIAAGPLVNIHLLVAGCFSLRDARENWCWGKEQTDNLAQSFPGIAERVRFMPPFTDPDLFDPDRVDRERRVLFTTTMHNIEKKGLPELLKAMARLPELEVRCVVRQPQHLPPIPPGCRRRMEIGGLPKVEMVGLYHRVWLNCRTSREESSPVSILESMICEVPQVTSPVVARQIPILTDGETGFLVDPDDTRGLVRALRRLLADRELRDAMGRECRRRALEYSFDARVRDFESLLS